MVEKKECPPLAGLLVKGLLLAGVLPGLVVAAPGTLELPPVPDKPKSELFKNAPAPWRDYLIQAREAERIADPLQRCLSYPDLPGNQWPAGHAEAHCRLHAAHRYTHAEIDGYLDRGQADELDRQLDAMLARHFSASDFGEDIDVAMEFLQSSSDEAGRVSARWLEAAPESPYANLARGLHLRAAAGKARGGAYASETPRENFARMSELIGQASPLYEEAIRLEPRLLPAHTALIDAARLDSRAEVERAAVERAKAIDPACVELAARRMEALQPKWGGSYEQMLALATELRVHVAERPLLASHVAAPFGERGDRKILADEMDQEALEVLEIAIRTGSLETYAKDAANVLMNSEDETVRDKDGWKALAYLLQEARFSERSAWTHRNIGRMLIRLAPAMGLIHLKRAAELEPENTYVQYAIGASLYNTGRHADAERHYLVAVEDPEYRQRSLRELSTMWMFDAGLERKAGAARAKPYIDRLLAEYPDDGRAWLYRFAHDGATHGRVDDEVVQNFRKVADASDPPQADFLKRLDEATRLFQPPAE